MDTEAPYTDHQYREWIVGLRRRGLSPEFRILEKCAQTELNTRERYWIAHYRLTGRLLNKSPGGGQRRLVK